MENNGADTANSGRTFKTVNGKTVGAGKEGNVSFVRFNKLEADGTTGVVAEGIYEGTVPNNFDEGKVDYKVRAENGDLTILNTVGSLKTQMEKIEPGAYVRISYLGKAAMKGGKFAGKLSHRVIVEIAD